MSELLTDLPRELRDKGGTSVGQGNAAVRPSWACLDET